MDHIEENIKLYPVKSAFLKIKIGTYRFQKIQKLIHQRNQTIYKKIQSFVKHLSIFESYKPLNTKEKALLERITNHSESWRKILADVSNDPTGTRFNRFIEHFMVLEFIQNNPKEMSSLIAPALKDNDMLRKWISKNSNDFPDDFKESVGIYSDLKDLGF